MTLPMHVETLLISWEESLQVSSSEINNVAEQKRNQIISQGGKEIERVLPNILRGAIEDMFQTHFCLLGKIGKQQLRKLKNKIAR